MESYIINKKINRTDKVVFLIAIIMFAFFPFSRNGQIYQSLYIFKNLFTIAFVLFYGIKRGYVDVKQLMIVIAVHSVLLLFTFTASTLSNISFKIDFASYSVIVPLTLLWIFKFRSNINVNNMDKIFNLFNVILIIWSLGIIFNVGWIKTITFNNYSQFADYTLPNMLSRNKPVMSFGTHSISSFSTFMMFMTNYITVKIRTDRKNYINVIFMLFYLFINVMTLSNTSLLASLAIIFFLFKPKKNFLKTLLLLLLLFIVMIIIVDSGILDQYTYRLFYQERNGFLARYFGELYSSNFEFIKSYGGMGILSSINNDFFLIDSGFLVLLSRGNIILVILFFAALYRFLKINLPSKYLFHIFIPIVAFEFAASLLLLDIRPIFLQILIIIYLKSITNEKYLLSTEKIE